MRAKQTQKRRRAVRRHRLALALVGAMAMPATVLAQNLPVGGSVVNGTASVSTTGPQMTVTQTTKGAIIDWGSFSIGSGYGVTFDQQFGASSVTLNRVVGFGYGVTPSSIDGTLTANGSVFLINPAGITFGSGAVVNVGGLVASTLDLANADFLTGLSEGHYVFTASGPDAGAIYNYAPITAADGGTVALIGSYILNAGTIRANYGSVGFGAAENVTLDFYGDGLTQVTISGNGLGIANCSLNCNGGITSSGNVFALGGHIEMRTTTMDGEPTGSGLFVDPANGGRIWISGNVVTRTDGSRKGSIVLDAGMGNIDLGGVEGQTGNVDAVGDNDGEDAGSIEIHANRLFTHLCVWTAGQCVNNNQLGFINATAYGAGGNGGSILIDVGHLYHAGWIQAAAAAGNGGLVDISADLAEIFNVVSVESAGGRGGTIDVTANSLELFRGTTPWLGGPGNLFALGTLAAFGSTSGGTVNIDAANFSMTDDGTITPDDVNLPDVYRPTISVNGFGGNGGDISIVTSAFTLGEFHRFEATGTGTGGNIDITADTIDLAGALVATGGTGGGLVTTTAPVSLFAGPTAYIRADTWRLHVPSAHILMTDGASPGSGAVLTDDALSATLDGGTDVRIFADDAMSTGASGSIYIGSGVSIVHATGNDASLHFEATAGIYGSGFTIASTGGPLDLSFLANINDTNPDAGYVSFYGIDIATNGGDIVMDGDGRGVYLEFSTISSAGGAITFTGNGDDNGVLVQGTDLASGGGAITIVASVLAGSAVEIDDSDIASNGGDITITGDGHAGVSFAYSSLVSAGGDIAIDGDGEFAGVYFRLSDVSSGDGDILVDGSASLVQSGYYPFGVALAGSSMHSTGGDIRVDGNAPGGTGLGFWSAYDPDLGVDVYSSFTTTSGAIALASTGLHGLALGGTTLTTDSGDISLLGDASDVSATAAVFIGSGGLITNGGDISIIGTGTTTGVWLYGGDIVSNGGDITVVGSGDTYGVQVWDNLVSSDAGDISIRGTATGSASNATGVSVRDAALAATTGNILVDGAAAGGQGVFFGGIAYGPGSSVTTTSGAITVASLGLSGLRVSDVPFTTLTGDITLRGTATANGPGVLVEYGGLTTNGGDITLEGASADGNGVEITGALQSNGGSITLVGTSTNGHGVHAVASGSPFGIHSGGGDIVIDGVGGVAGVTLGTIGVTSTGGDVSISGEGGQAGVDLQSLGIQTAGGAISIVGNALAADGTGISLHSVSLRTAGGALSLSGAGGLYGVRVTNSELDAGDDEIRIDGEAVAAQAGGDGAGVRFTDVGVHTAGGDVWIKGKSLAGIGVQVEAIDSSGVGITSAGGEIGIVGEGGTDGVAIGRAGVDSGGGNLAIGGTGGSGAGVRLASDSDLKSGAGLLAIAASNAGGSDAIILLGGIASTRAVNLRPMNTGDTILLGAGNGFSLTAAELAKVDAPLLVIGSSEHAGAIRVTEAVDRDDDLTLQNEGGSGGIDLQAAVDVGDHVLALASGGDITQTAAGAITAHSLLAIADGDVSLTAADNNVTATSVAGAAGGDFAYEDVDDVAIGTVTAQGFSPWSPEAPGTPGSPPTLVALSSTGITAEGSVLVESASGNLTLGADVSGTRIDLVAAETFHNPGGASLTASEGWRIWARTWEGEERGGLQGDGPFDVFGCEFGGDCIGIGSGNQFIYRERRFMQSPVAPETVVEWFDDDRYGSGAQDLLQAAICPVGDVEDIAIGQGSGNDELARDWLRTRHRLKLSNCIESKNVPGCKF